MFLYFHSEGRRVGRSADSEPAPPAQEAVNRARSVIMQTLGHAFMCSQPWGFSLEPQ